jgi:hypothetical protein
MEQMQYITKGDQSIQVIETCLVEAGYDAEVSINTIIGEVLHVSYKVEYMGKVGEAYCRWIKIVEGIEDLEKSVVLKIRHQDPFLDTLFTIEYGRYDMVAISKILSSVLNCYDGYIYYEGRLYGQHNIEELPNFRRDKNNTWQVPEM